MFLDANNGLIALEEVAGTISFYWLWKEGSSYTITQNQKYTYASSGGVKL
jgi:hypothetical protein